VRPRRHQRGAAAHDHVSIDLSAMTGVGFRCSNTPRCAHVAHCKASIAEDKNRAGVCHPFRLAGSV
jgi:hypothetical protein